MRRPVRKWTLTVVVMTLAFANLMPSAFAGAPLANGSTNALHAGEPSQARESNLAEFYGQVPAWSQCQGDSCTRIAVPLDYDNPAGQRISLAVRVIGSRNLPSLITNPGGPGSGGIDFARYLAASLAPQIRAAYSIVGFDPRGTGDSSPVECMTGKFANTWLRTDSTPDNRAEITTLMNRAQRISQGCLAFSPELAAHIGTEESARDIDIIRAVLGNESLNWLGFSYGTSLGARYLELFPERVGRMVLDGAVDPSLDSVELSRDQSDGFQTAITRFSKQYPGSIKRINSLLQDLERRSLSTDSKYRLVQSEAQTAILYSMYSPTLWPGLHRALKQAQKGDGSDLQEISYDANDQITPTKFGSNTLSAFYAINCWDYPAAPRAPQLRILGNEWAAQSVVPELAKAMSWSNAPCTDWFGHSNVLPTPAVSETKAPIVIIGTTYDPATPLKWARSLHEQLPTSSLVTYVGDGHTAYLGANSCVDSYVNTYLLTGQSSGNILCR